MGNDESFQNLIEMERAFTKARIEDWIHYDLFSYQWWMLVAVLIIPWFIWWKYVDKKRLLEISLYGAFVLLVVSYLDGILTELIFWAYKYKLVPIWPRLIAADFTALPVIYMMVYQYFREWKSFLIVTTIIAGAFAFIGEPFLQWVGIYKHFSWKHIYSFPIYIAIPAFLKWVVDKMIRKQISS